MPFQVVWLVMESPRVTAFCRPRFKALDFSHFVLVYTLALVFFTLCRGRDEIARKPGRAGCSYSYRVVVFMAELPEKKKHSQTIHTSR